MKKVKEKFGTLRFYYHLEGDKITEAHDAFIAGMVNFAELNYLWIVEF